jgi:MFS family permease
MRLLVGDRGSPHSRKLEKLTEFLLGLLDARMPFPTDPRRRLDDPDRRGDVSAHDLGSSYALALMFGLSYGAVMPLYAILVREYFGARIMGSTFGAVNMASTLGMALGPRTSGWRFDAYGSYFWLYIGSFGIGLGAGIAFAFRPPRELAVPLPSSSLTQSA